MGEKPLLTFGEELRRERLIRDVPLEEISAATKISVRLLTALERSDLSKLPAPVFTRGFIRAYSKHLGLDADEMVNAYLADLAPEKTREAAPKKGRLRSRFLRGRRGAAGMIVVTVTGVLTLLGLIARPERHPTPTAMLPSRPIASVSFKNVAPSPAPGSASASPEDSAPASETVTLVLEFDADSWTELSADGRRVFSGLVRRGEKHAFEARSGFRITLGNAGGVRVTVDGRALRPLGGTGEVVRDLPIPVAASTLS
jgi:cytoskeleton protein RodZ